MEVKDFRESVLLVRILAYLTDPLQSEVWDDEAAHWLLLEVGESGSQDDTIDVRPVPNVVGRFDKRKPVNIIPG